MYLGYSESELASLKATMTAKEIVQQPDSWKRTLELVHNQAEQLKTFLNNFLAKDHPRIILTGAGTSAFVGRAIQPYLFQLAGVEVEEIATTDLVSSPQHYFDPDRPTLVVSYGRSGNSPESVATVNLANQCVKDIYHLVVTCNPEGKLAVDSANLSNAYVLNMPPETNDGSFAMTSSYTSMMLATLAAFYLNKGCPTEFFGPVCEATRKLYPYYEEQARKLLDKGVERIIYLGTAGMQGLSQEAALKLLELTAGEIMATYDSPLGFRHGPKSMVNKNTAIFQFFSNDAYTSLYDVDLFNELKRDQIAKYVTAITANKELADKTNGIFVEGFANAQDCQLLFPYIVFAQIFAFYSSLDRNKTPDNPCPTGEVNRVVQGVTIHPFNQ